MRDKLRLPLRDEIAQWLKGRRRELVGHCINPNTPHGERHECALRIREADELLRLIEHRNPKGTS